MKRSMLMWVAIYRVGMRMLPAEFAARNGVELRQVFEDTLASHTGVTLHIIAARESVDILRVGIRLHLRRLFPNRRHAVGERRRVARASGFAQEMRYATRALRRSPAFSLSAVATLGLGIGAVAAIFNLAYGLWLAPLPYEDPLSLVSIRDSNEGMGANISAPELTDYAQVPSFSGIAAYHYGAAVVTNGGEPSRLAAYKVEPHTFALLGIRPSMGRAFDSNDLAAGELPVILSDRIWQRMFHRDPHVVGRTLYMRGGTARIIGVMPRRFEFPLNLPSDIWMPLDIHQAYLTRDTRLLHAIARLKPGRSLEQAQQEISIVSARLASAFPASNAKWRARVATVVEQTVGDYRAALMLLLGMVGLLLCIACANIASLFMARHMKRREELLVRVALGATSWRIRRMVMTESLLLSLVSGAVGVGVAYTLVHRLAEMLPSYTPRRDSIEMDAHVFLFAFAVSVVVGIVCGLASGSAASSTSSLVHGGRGVIGGARNRMRSTLVVAEVAFSLVLLVAAGLMGRSFSRLMTAERGYEPNGLLSMQVSVPFDKFETYDGVLLSFDRAIDAVRNLPGVEAVARAAGAPGSSLGTLCCGPVRTTPADGARTVPAIVRAADPAFFHVMHTPLLEGRAFTDRDREGSPGVAIVSRSVARNLFPGRSALGKTVIVPDPGGGRPEGVHKQIVGIATDMHDGTTAPSPDIYLPAAQASVYWSDIVVRTSLDPATLVQPVRVALRAADADYLIENVTPMTQILADQLALEHTQSVLARLFGTLATILCAIGLYGLLSNVVSQRVQEIGVRRALGAQNGDIFRRVVMRGVALTSCGIIAGAGGALALHRMAGTKLFGLDTIDPIVIGAASALLLTIALLASYVPARRAVRVDPLDAMR